MTLTQDRLEIDAFLNSKSNQFQLAGGGKETMLMAVNLMPTVAALCLEVPLQPDEGYPAKALVSKDMLRFAVDCLASKLPGSVPAKEEGNERLTPCIA